MSIEIQTGNHAWSLYRPKPEIHIPPFKKMFVIHKRLRIERLCKLNTNIGNNGHPTRWWSHFWCVTPRSGRNRHSAIKAHWKMLVVQQRLKIEVTWLLNTNKIRTSRSPDKWSRHFGVGRPLSAETDIPPLRPVENMLVIRKRLNINV